MTNLTLRNAEQIRLSCARKIGSIEIGLAFAVILAFLLGDRWASRLVGDMRLTPAGSLLIRSTAATAFTVFRSAEVVLLRGFLQIAYLAGLDGDELRYLLGRLAQLKV